jgi:hypothetical protein
MVITAFLLAASIALAVRCGYSPLALVSPDADRKVVDALQARFRQRD